MDTADPNALVARFWDELREIRTGMLGLVNAREAHSQPMTAHFEGTSGPLWFYTRRDSELAKAIGADHRGVFHYVGPDHDLYACVHGDLAVSHDQATIDRFWSSEVARWFPEGRPGSSVALLRFEPDEAQIWLPATSADKSLIRFRRADAPVDIRAKASL